MSETPTETRRPRVALSLGAGGAKGLAYIGAIEEIEACGYEIVAIAGSSMGALIGGIYAAGKLDVYRDWVSALAKLDVLRLVDWSLSGGGLIKGERIIDALRELIGDEHIEDLPIAYTAVATDIDRQREIWLDRGPLFDAIRASIAIPSVFRPHMRNGRRLVDGGLLNPVPVMPLLNTDSDYIVAVSVDGPAEKAPLRVEQAADPEDATPPGHRQRIAEFVARLVPHGEPKVREPGALELLNQAMDLMQANLASLRLAAYQPDLLIELPRNMATSYQFYRARELIERGRSKAREALDGWERLEPRPETTPDHA
ncbi:MAG TPA: patatin-like phospholipase family protein [Oleiagrimonas sp.]|nr:patatin-like phospholipase family protein [Oleiagrimonas sp.]